MIETFLQTMVTQYGSLGLFVVMVIQTIIAPLPSEMVIMLAGAIGISFPIVVAYGGLGLIVGAIIAFFIAKVGREVVVEKLVSKKWMKRVDKWVEEKGTLAILISRLIPLVPFDLVSYVAGLTKIEFKNYLLATILGAFPRVAVLALAGSSTGSFLAMLGMTIETIFYLGIAAILAFLILDKFGYVDKFKEKVLSRLIERKR